MNFFKRKFSFTDEEETNGLVFDEVSSTPSSSFSLSKMAEKVSSTISAPTSPVRSSETLARALERSLQPSSLQPQQQFTPDAKILLVIDDDLIDWSKYFRCPGPSHVRVEQANFEHLHLQCTEHACIVEISLPGGESRHFTAEGVFIASSSSLLPCSSPIIRSLLTANLSFLNSHTAVQAFLSISDLKKELRKLKLRDGSPIPFLPSIHYPNFHKFNPTNHFPIVVSVGDVKNGNGKIRVNSSEELQDLEGVIRSTNKFIQVEVEPFVDIKYDLHVQKVGKEWKTFRRRGIYSHWKSNACSAVLEQIKTNPNHIEWIEMISSFLGGCSLLSIDILVSKDGREFVHSISDTLRYYGESQEEDRRSVCGLLKEMITRHSNDSTPTPTSNGRRTSIERPQQPPRPKQTEEMTQVVRTVSNTWQPLPPEKTTNEKDSHFAEDTMGQLKRTFAGIFGDMTLSGA